MVVKKSGFTIVELLIVIVVIGILAAITIVAYNGVQQRASNTKTQNALVSWIKGLQLYKTENNRWPGGWVCLGQEYPYGVSGTVTSGAQCRQSGSGMYSENTTFNDAVKPYLGGSLPTPAFVTVRSTDTEWRRGLFYAYGGGGDGKQVYISASYAGKMSSCPSVGGYSATMNTWGNNTYCDYYIGLTTDT